MAKIIIDVPNRILPRILDAFAANGYNEETDGDKETFVKNVLINYIKDVTQRYERWIIEEELRARVEEKLRDLDIT
jgi:hypothetical protein